MRDPGASTLAQSIPFLADAGRRESSGRRAWSAHVARAAGWLVAVAFGGVQVLANLYLASSEDVVSYLDIADAYRHHHWKAALNGYWSPLYSWLLGLLESLIRPAPAWELPFVRFVNFVIYLFAIAAFEFFLEQTIASHEAAVLAHRSANSPLRIPRWMWRLAGYSLFLWSTLTWIDLRSDTPDLCATALVLAACGILARAARAPLSRKSCIVLGAIAGFAYLAKTAMFPVAFLFVAGAGGTNVRRGLGRSAWTLFGCAIVTVPFILSLSSLKHRLTIGDSGRMNYVWNVNPGGYVVPGLHWQGGPPGFGVPTHPTRQIWEKPAVFEFDNGEQTYAPWTDPSHWYDGLQVQFSVAAQVKAVFSNAAFYGRMFLLPIAALYAVLLCLRAFGPSIAALAKDNWRLVIVSGSGLMIYMFATNLTAANIPAQPSTRYVAVFVLVLCAVIVSSVRLPDSTRSRRVLASLSTLVAVLLGGQLAVQSALNLKAIGGPPPEDLWNVVAGLRDVGIGPGERVAILGRKGEHVFYARLGRIRIVSQIPDAEEFLHADPAVQEGVLAALARTGAVALVGGHWWVASHRGQTWQRLGYSPYYAVRLTEWQHPRTAP